MFKVVLLLIAIINLADGRPTSDQETNNVTFLNLVKSQKRSVEEDGLGSQDVRLTFYTGSTCIDGKKQAFGCDTKCHNVTEAYSSVKVVPVTISSIFRIHLDWRPYRIRLYCDI